MEESFLLVLDHNLVFTERTFFQPFQARRLNFLLLLDTLV